MVPDVFTKPMRNTLRLMALGYSWDHGVSRIGGGHMRMMYKLEKAGCVTPRPWKITPKGRGIGTGSTKP